MPSATAAPASTASAATSFLPAPAPLADLLVIDLTRFVSGPYCTMLMADAGATVVKIESPAGDTSRWGQPAFPGGEGSVGATFLRMNRNKRSVTLDLKSPAGRSALARLITKADVLVENFRHGVLAGLGFDETALHELNPGLIYCTITGFGHSPSDQQSRPAFNLIAEYEAGVYSQTDPNGIPAPLGPYVGDLFPGLHALSGVLMALHRRSVTGAGGRVDIAMFDSMLSLNEAAASNATWLGDPVPGGGPSFYCPSGVFPGSDGFVCIDLVTDRQWEALCQIIGRVDLYANPQLSTGPGRSVNYELLLAEPLLAWLAEQTCEQAVSTLGSAGVPSAVVRKPGEALTSRQAGQRSMVVEVAQGPGARLKVPASPIRIDDLTASPLAEVPYLGQHTVEVLRDVAGLTTAQIDEVQAETLSRV